MSSEWISIIHKSDQSWTHLGHKRSPWFQDVSGDVQSLRDKQLSVWHHVTHSWTQVHLFTHSQQELRLDVLIHVMETSNYGNKSEKRIKTATGKTAEIQETRSVSVSPSGAPSHTTRSAGWPSKWRIISWAVDTWEEEDKASHVTHNHTKAQMSLITIQHFCGGYLVWDQWLWLCHGNDLPG